MSKNFFVILLGLMTCHCASAAGLLSDTAFLQLNKNVLKNANYHKIDFGFQGDISDKQVDADVGFGEVATIFLQLPPRKHVINVDLTTMVDDEKVYYPVVVLLDKDFNWISIFEKGKLNIHQRGLSQAVSNSHIKISPFVKYLVITTRSQLLGNQLRYEKTESKAPQFPGAISQPDYSMYTIQHSAQYSATPHLELVVPAQNETLAVRKQTGIFIEAGLAFGNEAIALKPNGDNYKVGSGTLYGFGYAINTPHWKNLTYRFSAGFREQGGVGHNEGVYAQLLALKEWHAFNLGAGIYADLKNTVTAPDNSEFKFDDAYGLQLDAEWRLATHINIASKYVLINYRQDNGDKYKGNQFLLQMQFFN